MEAIKMAKGGKRSGAGRKAEGRVSMMVRVAPEIKKRLERDAKRAHRSLSAEAELYFRFRQAPRGEPRIDGLCNLLEQINAIGKSLDRNREPEFDWCQNRFDFEVFKNAIVRIIDRLAPEGPIEDSRYREAQTPEEIGRLIMEMAIVLLRTRELEGDPKGSIFRIFPQIALTFGIKESQS
jgi:hypothetical protein